MQPSPSIDPASVFYAPPNPLLRPLMYPRVKRVCSTILPAPVWKFVLRQMQSPRVGKVNFGDLRRMRPISQKWGFDRGTPIDRYYIDGFMEDCGADITGHCLEIGDDRYSRQFGKDVTKVDVMNYAEGDPMTTIVGDLVTLDQPDGTFDCIICPETLQFVSNPFEAVANMRRMLKPGGTLLMSVPTLSRLDVNPGQSWHDRWRFTSIAVASLANACRDKADEVAIQGYGNVLTATAFLQGLATSELTQQEIDQYDVQFEMQVTLRLKKAS